ncbi:MAG: SCO family protein [Longimicrobiales bacterium]
MFRVRKASLVTIIAVVLLLGGLYLLRGSRAIAGIPLDTPAPDFRLDAPYRGAVSIASYQGDAVLLTFGRPSCGAGCNPQLTTLADALDRLGDRRNDVRVLFATLEADLNEQQLLAFVQDYDLGFTGLRGDSTAVRELAAAYREAEATVADSVVSAAALAPAADGPRLYGIDRSGTLRAVWGPDDPAALARDIRTLLRYR